MVHPGVSEDDRSPMKCPSAALQAVADERGVHSDEWQGGEKRAGRLRALHPHGGAADGPTGSKGHATCM